MLKFCLFFFLMFAGICSHGADMQFFPANHDFIRYVGRFDFTRPSLPRAWQPGVYIDLRFTGSKCQVIINDEMLWGTSHNYLEIVVDNKPVRIRTNSKTDTITVAENLPAGTHDLRIVKNTEANIGYIELVGVICEELVRPLSPPNRKLEFIGNSITCGAGSDDSEIPCGKGVWQDQHNAYLSYGALSARQLMADYHLSSVSGIGLMHSCCGIREVMPEIFDKVSMRMDTIAWNFSSYQPDLVTVCLGQNDGIQDAAVFSTRYIEFISKLREYYPSAMIVLLSSPMADASLAAWMKSTLTTIQQSMLKAGEKKLEVYFFIKQYHKGCDGHPNLEEHKEIAEELSHFIKKRMNW